MVGSISFNRFNQVYPPRVPSSEEEIDLYALDVIRLVVMQYMGLKENSSLESIKRRVENFTQERGIKLDEDKYDVVIDFLYKLLGNKATVQDLKEVNKSIEGKEVALPSYEEWLHRN